MRYVRIFISTLFCLLVQQNIHAQTLYTWKDTAGTIHITRQKPPQGRQLTDQLRYTTSISSQPSMETASPPDMGDHTVLAAARKAILARQQAQEARQLAQEAIQEANQNKKETEAFLEPWRGKKRIRKNIQLQIEGRIQKANKLIAHAERLIDAANEAELKAQAAEKEARRIQDQFFEAYRMIVSN